MAPPVHHRLVGLGDPGRACRRGEDAATAAAREVLEETGWRCGPLVELTRYEPVSGLGDSRYVLYAARVPSTSASRANRRRPSAWNGSRPKLREEIRAGRAPNGLSLTALLWCLSFGVL